MSPTAEPRRLRLRVQGAQGTSVLEFADVSAAEAVRRAAMQGLRVLAVEPIVAASAAVGTASGPIARGASMRGDGFALLLFTQELLSLLEAGLNLTEAIQTLQAKERGAAARVVLDAVLGALREGRNFSDALAAMPQHFPDVYVATARASERTGDLPQALARYIAYQQQFDAIRKKLVSAAIYPVMLLIVGGFVTLFLLGYVVPKFSAVYESAGRDMPWLSAALLRFGRVIHDQGAWTLAAVLAAVGAFAWTVSRAGTREALLERVLRMPWLRSRAQGFQLARFYRGLSLLLGAGIALPRAMGMAAGLLAPTQRARLDAARLAVEEGRSLSDALGAQQLSSPVADSLLRVGERSGQMAEMLERTARFQDEDFARWVDWASRLLEPVLMMVIGLVIGTIVVLMYMPIFELAGSLQ